MFEAWESFVFEIESCRVFKLLRDVRHPRTSALTWILWWGIISGEEESASTITRFGIVQRRLGLVGQLTGLFKEPPPGFERKKNTSSNNAKRGRERLFVRSWELNKCLSRLGEMTEHNNY